jgi:hypothetical protein
MSDDPKPGVIGSLPRTRPHRRSSKRAAPAGAPPVDTQAQQPAVVKAAAAPKTAREAKPATVRAAKPATVRAAKPATARPGKPAAAKRAPAKPGIAKAKPAPAQPGAASRAATPAPPPPREPSPGVLETAVQAAAELTEIGLRAGARALRRVASRLPRP